MAYNPLEQQGDNMNTPSSNQLRNESALTDENLHRAVYIVPTQENGIPQPTTNDLVYHPGANMHGAQINDLVYRQGPDMGQGGMSAWNTDDSEERFGGHQHERHWRHHGGHRFGGGNMQENPLGSLEAMLARRGMLNADTQNAIALIANDLYGQGRMGRGAAAMPMDTQQSGLPGVGTTGDVMPANTTRDITQPNTGGDVIPVSSQTIAPPAVDTGLQPPVATGLDGATVTPVNGTGVDTNALFGSGSPDVQSNPATPPGAATTGDAGIQQTANPSDSPVSPTAPGTDQTGKLSDQDLNLMLNLVAATNKIDPSDPTAYTKIGTSLDGQTPAYGPFKLTGQLISDWTSSLVDNSGQVNKDAVSKMLTNGEISQQTAQMIETPDFINFAKSLANGQPASADQVQKFLTPEVQNAIAGDSLAAIASANPNADPRAMMIMLELGRPLQQSDGQLPQVQQFLTDMQKLIAPTQPAQSQTPDTTAARTPDTTVAQTPDVSATPTPGLLSPDTSTSTGTG